MLLDKKAQNNGGDLIVIKSQADQSYFESVITQESWIGLFQNFGSSNFSEPHGGWEWVDGTALIWDEILILALKIGVREIQIILVDSSTVKLTLMGLDYGTMMTITQIDHLLW